MYKQINHNHEILTRNLSQLGYSSGLSRQLEAPPATRHDPPGHWDHFHCKDLVKPGGVLIQHISVGGDDSAWQASQKSAPEAPAGADNAASNRRRLESLPPNELKFGI